MIHKYMLFTVLCIVGVFNVAAQDTQQSVHRQLGHISATTVDENGVAIRADSVQWWVKGKRDTKYNFQCDNEWCNRWVHERFQPKEDIVIYASASVMREDDNACWDLYAGERLLSAKTQNNEMKEVQVVLHFSGTVCS